MVPTPPPGQEEFTNMQNTLPGMIVDMPIYASHHEPEFFPEPTKFDPERFLKENATDIIPHTYRPFGGKLDFVVRLGQNTYH